MDRQVEAIALGALRRIGGGGSPEADPGQSAKGMRLEVACLADLSDLANLRAENPLVERVLEALRKGEPVLLDRDETSHRLDLGAYPPPLRERFAGWFSDLSSMGVAFPSASSAPRPYAVGISPPASAPVQAPEGQVLEAILGALDPGSRPCLVEAGKPCSACGGRCRTLGF